MCTVYDFSNDYSGTRGVDDLVAVARQRVAGVDRDQGGAGGVTDPRAVGGQSAERRTGASRECRQRQSERQ